MRRIGLAALVAVLPLQAFAAPRAAEPKLVPIRKAHCLKMYDYVANALKGRPDAVSAATRNGLKDFFVIRPGVIDCKGARDIPWRDDKDRAFIEKALGVTNAAFKAKLDMTRDYGVGPAAAASAAPPR